MQAQIFDGHVWQPCTVELATRAGQDTSLSWIDVRLTDDSDTSAETIFNALGVSPGIVARSLESGLQTVFELNPEKVEGVAWINGDDGTAEQARFTFDGRRLVTVRTGGDKAFAQVQQQLAARADLAVKQPTRVVGFVLQAMLITVQQGLTDLSVQIGALDLDIITESVPSAGQSQQLVAYRQRFQPFAMRFPSYVMAVNASLLDPDTITALDAPGVAELQTFAGLSRSTESMVMNVADSIRNAVQDLQGQVSNWQGNRINQLTVVTILFLPITFLTGYFGMNFNWIDNLLATEGSYFIFGLALPILVVAGSSIWLARRGFRISLGPETRKERRHERSATTDSSIRPS